MSILDAITVILGAISIFSILVAGVIEKLTGRVIISLVCVPASVVAMFVLVRLVMLLITGTWR